MWCVRAHAQHFSLFMILENGIKWIRKTSICFLSSIDIENIKVFHEIEKVYP